MKRIKFVRYDKGEGNGFFLLEKDGELRHSELLDWLLLIAVAVASSIATSVLYGVFHSC